MNAEKGTTSFFRSKIFLVGASMLVLAGVALGAVLGALASSGDANEPTFSASSGATPADLPEPVAPSQVETGNEGEPFATYSGTGTSSIH
jgi:hypothetical protein